MRRLTFVALLVISISALSVSAGMSARRPITTTLSSADSNEIPANGYSSGNVELSRNGRFMVFGSIADNLSARDADTNWDIFVRDHKRGLTLLATQSSSGIGANAGSAGGAVSQNGRVVAFYSEATNLVGGDTNGWNDVFVRSLRKGRTSLASLSSSETQGNDGSFSPSLSRTGRFVAFMSRADNLTGGDTNATHDVFVRDRRRGLTFLVSQNSNEVQGNASSTSPSISANGRFVSFGSYSDNLVPGTQPGEDVFVRDLKLGRTYLASQNSNEIGGNGESYQASISGNGRFVAFISEASNLTGTDSDTDADIFVRDLKLGRTYLISQSSNEVPGDDKSIRVSISHSGRFVAFVSHATNLTGGDTNMTADVYVRDRLRGRTYLISQNSEGIRGDDFSDEPGISGNGRFVGFVSWADNLSTVDDNNAVNAFRRGRLRY